MMNFLLTAFIYLLFLTSFQAQADAPENAHAVIINYTRIGEQNYPDTNTLTDQFIAQLEYLKAEGFSILSLDDVINSFIENKAFEEKTVALTFDGGYQSLNNILPIIIKEKIPVTIFLALGAVEKDSPQFLDSKEIKKLERKKFINFQITTNNFQRLPQSKAEILEQVNNAKSLYRELFNKEPVYFSYPYGEYNLIARDIIEEQNFKAAFAQHSSPATAQSDLFSIPRFAISEEFAGLERFSLIVNSYPLGVSNFTPNDPVLETTSPAIGFTLNTPVKHKDDLSCYLSELGNVDLTFLDETRVEIRLPRPLTEGRSRLNCTFPFIQDDKRYWKWFGRLFILQQDELLTLLE